MKIKNTVKVMNFHSLLRVDHARKKAEQYATTEKHLTEMIKTIVNNKNIILDKKMLSVPHDKPILNIYIGNDYGFCGNFNNLVKEKARKDLNSDKIVIGRKIPNNFTNTLLYLTKEEFYNKFSQIEDLIMKQLLEKKNSEVHIIYNHYYNSNNIEFIDKKVYPVDFKELDKKEYKEDFVVEGDLNSILLNLIGVYICYEIRIAEANSWASENIMRQNVTRDSLKKIDEIDEENKKINRKILKQISFKKILETYTKGINRR